MTIDITFKFYIIKNQCNVLNHVSKNLSPTFKKLYHIIHVTRIIINKRIIICLRKRSTWLVNGIHNTSMNMHWVQKKSNIYWYLTLLYIPYYRVLKKMKGIKETTSKKWSHENHNCTIIHTSIFGMSTSTWLLIIPIMN